MLNEARRILRFGVLRNFFYRICFFSIIPAAGTDCRVGGERGALFFLLFFFRDGVTGAKVAIKNFQRLAAVAAAAAAATRCAH